MKRTGYINRRIVALLTAFMLLCSCLSVFTGVSFRTKALEDIEIRSFGASFADGAVLSSGKYVYTPQYADAGHLFIYRVYYSLSGEGFFEPGEVVIRMPKNILRDRDGNYADECELSIPSRQDLEEYEDSISEIDTSFVYEYDENEIVIRNFGDGEDRLKAGSTGYIEIGYRMTKQTYYYKDMAPSEPFWANIKIFNASGDEIASASSEAPEVYVDTYATLVSTNKRCMNIHAPYSSWQDSWGRAPENAEDYYYLVWELRSYIGAVTQPYTFVIDDTVLEADAEPVAYKLWGTNSFKADCRQENLTAERFVRYDYVITRHLKSTYEPLDRYKITNTETASVIPKDNADPPTSATSTDEFNFVRTGYGGPGGYFYHRKWGNNNWWYRFNYWWEVADYGLQDLRDGTVDHLSGNIKYFVEASSYSYRWTLEEGADAGDLSKYGKRNVTSVLTDDSFYLNDNIIQTEDLRVIVGEDERKLTSEDFSIEYVDYEVIIRDGEFNEQDGDFVSCPVNYNDEDILYFYGKFGSGEEWLPIASYALKTKTAAFDSNYVEALTANRIVFKDNCVGYRIEVSNLHYSTSFTAYPYCRIKNSEYVMQHVGDSSVEKIWLTNISDYEARDIHGTLLHQSRSMARDYIIGVEKISEFEKRVLTTRSDQMKRTVTVGWRINLAEYYIANYGIVYVPQDKGVFYDLLPVGCGVDKSTVALSVGEGDYSLLDKSEYRVKVIDNYNDTGRTMLIVEVKEQFSRAILTFNTVTTWDNIIEYGTVLHNSAAFETDNERITDGSNDDGGDIRESQLMKGLDPDCEGDRFVYTEHDSQLRFLVASFTGLYKKVKSVDEALFTEVTNVHQKSLYSYKLRYSTSAISRAKNMILFDSLENFRFEGKHSEWHGTLMSADLSQAEEMGISPVVYLSGIENLDLESHHDLEEMLNGERVWKSAEDFGDITAAKAVAVDLRYDSEGNDYILDYRSAVSVILYMMSPESDETGSDDPVCFNNVYMSNTVIDLLGNEQSNFIHQDNTEVHYRVAGSFSIEKRGSEVGEPAIKGIGFTLKGTSDYGTETEITAKTDKYGHITFENIEKGREYELWESENSDDYLPIDHTFAVAVDDHGNVTIDGQPVDENDFFRITDDPRIHTDIEFFKRDLVRKQKLIEGTEFVLQGESVYGNTVNVRATSDENGRVVFKNIEKGSNYTLTETRTDEDHILSTIEYKVVVDDNAHFFITVKSPEELIDSDFTPVTELNGTVSVYNEPYHSFTLQKEGTIKIDGEALPVSGAEYRFWGTSDYSTDYDFTKTTQANGRIYFEQLEAGTYHLQEMNAPEGYELDTTEYIVEILPTDEITIKAKGGGRIVSRNNMGYFVFTDNEKGTITITKKWIDTPESLAERLANDTTPVIHISTEPKRSEAFFSGELNDIWQYASPLAKLTSDASDIKAFLPYTGNDNYVQELIANQKAKKIDDGTTDYDIYAWLDSNGTVYWWSNAKNVYLLDKSHRLWYMLPECVTIDASGINTSKLTDMSWMFRDCLKLKNLDLNSFDSSNVLNMKMMFRGCTELQSIDLSVLNTHKVNNMEGFFYQCAKLQEVDLSVLDGSSNLYTSYMFQACGGLKKVHFGNFKTFNVISMAGMFEGCAQLTEVDLEKIDTTNVRSMYCMFNACNMIESLDVSHFKTNNVNNMAHMFRQCSRLKQLDVSNFDTSNVTSMECMFRQCTDLNYLDVSKFITTNVENMSEMFYLCSSLPTIDVSKWKTSSCKNMSSMFSNCYVLGELDLRSFDTKKVTNMASMFCNCSSLTSLTLTSFETSNVKDMNQMFCNCSNIVTIELDKDKFDTGSVTNMNWMFRLCGKLKNVDVSGFDTKSVTNMTQMFNGDSSLVKLDVKNWNTKSVNYMGGLFAGCTNLTDLDTSLWTADALYNSSLMFQGCQKIPKIDLRNFNTKNVSDMSEMFYQCYQLSDLNIDSLDTRNVKNMNRMFKWCFKLTSLDLFNFNTSLVTNMSEMFQEDRNLVTVYVSELWSTANVTSSNNTFIGCTQLKGENDTVYSESHINAEYARIDNPPDEPGYFTYKPAPTTTGSGARTVTKRVFTTSSSAGTAYVSTDDNCKLTKLTEDTWEYTFTSIPPDLQFYTWEDELEGYTSENMGEVNHVAVVDGRATIVNRANDIPEESFGSLTLRKLVVREDGAELTEEQAAKKFTFTVRLYDENSQPVTETALYGVVPYGRNGAVITLANDESVTMTDIPAGYSYSVTEADEAGYTSAVTEGENTGLISEDAEITVTFTNTLVDETVMSFRLKKLVTGNYEHDDESYQFRLSLSGLQSGKSYSITGDKDMTYTANGQGTAQFGIELANGQEITVELPVGAGYSVTEEGGDYTASYKLTNPGGTGIIRQSSGSTMNKKNTSLTTALETADEGESVLVTFTNTRDARQSLILKKTLENASPSDSFEFTVDLIGLPQNETVDVVFYNSSGARENLMRESADANGRLEGLKYYLSGDERIEFSQLPVGTKYRITEEASAYKAAYKIEVGGELIERQENELTNTSLTTGEADNDGNYTEEGMNIIHEGGDVEVTYTNTKLQREVTITKSADFSESDMSYSERKALEFTFLVSFKGLTSGNAYRLEYTDKDTTGIIGEDEFSAESDGSADIRILLKDGMSCRISDLPIGAAYTVTEEACPRFISEYSIEGNSNSLIARFEDKNTEPGKELSTAKETVNTNDHDILILFKNTYNASDFVLPAAGVDDMRGLTAAALSGLLLFAALYFISYRRKYR